MSCKSEQTLPKVHHLPSACHSAIPGNVCFQPDVSGLSVALRTGERPAEAEMRLLNGTINTSYNHILRGPKELET